MKIRAVRAAEVGPFSRGVALEGLSGGLDILTGPNETGKSTLFAALSILIDEKHTSTSRAVSVLRPDRGGAPLIEADIEIDGRLWRVRKQYLANKSAELTCIDSGEVHRGANAEERLAELLGGRATLRSFIWVPQGGSFDLPDPRGKSAPDIAASLSHLIEQEAADAAGAALPRRIGEEVSVRLGALVTAAQGKAKAGGDLDLALRRRAEIAGQLEAARGKAQAAAARAERLAMLISARRAADGAAGGAGLAERLVAVRKAVADADQARERLRTVAERVTSRQLALDGAQRTLEGLVRSIEERDRIDVTVAGDREKMARLGAARAESEALVNELRLACDAIGAEVAEHRKLLARAHEAELRDVAKAELVEVERRLAAATTAAAELEELQRRLAVEKVTLGQVGELRGLASQLAALEAKVAAGAAVASIEYLPGVAARIKLDGREIADGAEVLIERPLRLAIDGIGSVLIVPPSRGEDVAKERDACRAALASALERIGASDVAAVEAMLERRRGYEQAAGLAQARLGSNAPQGIVALTRQRDEVAGRATGGPGEVEGAGRGVLAAQLATLEVALAEKHSALARAEASMRAAAADITRLEAKAWAAEQRRAEIEAALAPAQEIDAARARHCQAIEVASAALADAVREKTAWQEAAPDGPAYDALCMQVRRAAEALSAHEQAVAVREREIAELEGALHRDGEDGVGAEIAGLEEEHAAAAARVEDLELEVRALEMLRQRLERLGSRQREEVLRPVVERLQRLLDALLPGTLLHLDGPLLVARIERSGRADTMSRLSGGTREQVATLVRMAYAELMAARGVPVPLVLDDALVFSDDERLTVMMGMLADAARHHQVIVLSCRSRALEPVLAAQAAAQGAGPMARRLELVPWGDAGGARTDGGAQKGRARSPASGGVVVP